ncbi:hypothetical protein Plhal304r1_c021g0073651 [Plasmopara halstedii]
MLLVHLPDFIVRIIDDDGFIQAFKKIPVNLSRSFTPSVPEFELNLFLHGGISQVIDRCRCVLRP